jgi:hypothetical protein
MGEYLDEIMMLAFIVATSLGIYKFYVIFEKQKGDGVDIVVVEDEIIHIIKDLLGGSNYTKSELFEAIKQHPEFSAQRHRSFNENRFNQILYRLYLENGIEDFEALKDMFKKR